MSDEPKILPVPDMPLTSVARLLEQMLLNELYEARLHREGATRVTLVLNVETNSAARVGTTGTFDKDRMLHVTVCEMTTAELRKL